MTDNLVRDENLISHFSNIRIPVDWKQTGLVLFIPGPGSTYVVPAALALTNEAVWVCTPDQRQVVVSYQNIREVEVKDFRGATLEMEIGGTREVVNPRDAWGVVVKYQKLGNFAYSFSCMTYFANTAYEWQHCIQQAINTYDATLHGGMAIIDQR